MRVRLALAGLLGAAALAGCADGETEPSIPSATQPTDTVPDGPASTPTDAMRDETKRDRSGQMRSASSTTRTQKWGPNRAVVSPSNGRSAMLPKAPRITMKMTGTIARSLRPRGMTMGVMTCTGPCGPIS